MPTGKIPLNPLKDIKKKFSPKFKQKLSPTEITHFLKSKSKKSNQKPNRISEYTQKGTLPILSAQLKPHKLTVPLSRTATVK